MTRAIVRSFVLAALTAAAGWAQLTVSCTLTTGPVEVAVPYSNTCTAAGGTPPYAWTIVGSNVPSGLTDSITPTGNPATIAYTPTSALANYQYLIVAIDSLALTGNKLFTGTIAAAVAITTTSPLPGALAGIPYTQQFGATAGVSPYSWTATGQPSWLTMSTTGLLSGTPPSAGTVTFTAQVTDFAGGISSGSFSFTVTAPLTITTNSPLPAGMVGVTYSQTLTATGGSGPYTWAVTTGTLPPVLTLNPATGVIGGTPTTAGTSSFTVQVSDSTLATATKAFTLTINPALAITTVSPLPPGTVNVSYSQTLTATGGSGPYTWAVTTGTLPPVLTLNPITGLIGGTPTTAGTSSFTVQVTDSTLATASKAFTLTINPALAITTISPLPPGTVNVSYSQTLTATGGSGPYTWSVTTGTLPPVLTLNATTGVISGTPTTAGTSNFTVQVTDSTLATASKAFTLTINPALAITTISPLPPGTVNVSYSQTLTATGGSGPYTWSVTTGTLPPVLTLNATTGVISGTPTTAGTSNFTVQVTDSTLATATKAFTLTINPALAITTISPLPPGTVNVSYSQTLTATGGSGPYTWAVTTGTLPPVLTLNSTTGVISGTPTTAGTSNFTVQVTDSTLATATKAFTLTINPALAITTISPLPPGTVNVSYSQTLTATGGSGPYTWAVTTGTLPPVLTLNPTTGVISGTPTTAGTYAFTVKVVDSLGATATRQFTIVVAVGLTITTPATLPNATVGIAYTYLLLASGGTAPYTWTNPQGSPPTGISLGSNGSLTGVPTVAGTFNFKVQVTDSLGHQASQQISLTSPPPLIITTSTLSNGAVGVPYSQSLAVTGGTPPYSWSIQGGALPGGLSLAAAGTIAGTPSASGTFSFTVGVADSASATATKRLSIAVAGGLTVTTAGTLPNAFINASYSQNLAAAGGTPPYTWALTSGALPAGLTLTAAGLVSGTPTAAGTCNFPATVTDSASGTASQQFTLVVGGGLSISTTSLPGGQSGTPYSQTLTATGGTPPYTFTVSAGSLPPGITLNGANLSGTPTKTGSYTFTIQVSDSIAATATQQFTIAITGLAITSPALPGAAVGTPYTVTLLASGIGPFTWAITQGALPGGLTLDASTGTIF